MNASLHQRLKTVARRLPLDLLITTGFNIVCALVITYMMRIGTPFYQNLVFSLCIGTLALLLIDGGRLLLWGDGKPPGLPFLVLLLISVPVAYQGGTLLAAKLLGLPSHDASAGLSGNLTGFLILTLVASLSITWFFWNRERMQLLRLAAETEKSRAAFIEQQALQAQLQLLQAQIEPHMLFNTLANLQGLIAVDPARASILLDQLIHYLRATLSSSRAATTTLAHEFALMDAYLGVMGVRMGPRLSCSLTLPEALRETRIAPMLLQPLVENAIRHGLEPKLEGGRIEVSASLTAGMLTLCVADTGLGLDETPAAGTRLGLANVRQRLQALYGDAASLSLEPNAASGTTGAVAHLRIPIAS